MNFNTSKKGFTLVEVIVTCGIIAILASIVYANFSSARQSARDDIRKTDLKELQLALEMYKAQHGRYPAGCNPFPAWSGEPSDDTYDCDNGSSDYIVGLAPEFIDELPTDPKGATPGRGYLYYVNSAGTAYKVMAHWTVEQNFLTSYSDEFARCPRVAANCPTIAEIAEIYAVYSPGGELW